MRPLALAATVDPMELTQAKRAGAQLRARRERLEAQIGAVRDQLRELAETMLRAGHAPREVREATGWSPAQVRIIARNIGVEPARSGRPRGSGRAA